MLDSRYSMLDIKDSQSKLKLYGIGSQEFGSRTRRRPIGRDYAAAKDAEDGK